MIVLESKLLTRIKLCAELKITSFLIAYNSYTNRYLQAEKKPAAQIAHLVFADTQAKTKKNKRAIFCQRSIFR
ncbi:hypothetical protein [Membranihabitans marinus]|uniref:hypothetical protein n=1 Tax=Membranihabitans marinus TaxID=1227546 RepID=UPI001F160936|nr:hypothetical protein [Membranihabitans marinus]